MNSICLYFIRQKMNVMSKAQKSVKKAYNRNLGDIYLKRY